MSSVGDWMAMLGWRYRVSDFRCTIRGSKAKVAFGSGLWLALVTLRAMKRTSRSPRVSD